MKEERGRRRGLRFRITVAFLGAALAVSALVAVTTYLLVERYLVRQRVDAATRQSYSNVAFAARYLSTTVPTPSLFDVGTLLEARGAFETLLVLDDDEHERYYSSSVSLTPKAVPRSLAAVVRGEGVGYSFSGADPQRLVFGSPIPFHDLSAYFFYSLRDLDQTLAVLRRVLLGVAIAAVALAALAGTRVSARVVDPVRRASRAARQVADGLLTTRLPVTGHDELASLARSFNDMAEALEGLIARERRFVGDVSHELRTPLTTVRASTEYLLGRRRDLPPPLRRAVQLLAADLDYLQGLVDDLLELSRTEGGSVHMAWERLNFADLTREVVARRTRSGRQSVEVVVDADQDDLSTMGDKKRLERIVGNLVDNALMHGRGQDVTVRVGTRDGMLTLSVEDRGPGIPPEARTRIFERFFKADRARHRGDGRGAGLGLAIARENAHLHGGDIEVDSAPGQGSRFTFRFPRWVSQPEER